ncbi:PIN domain-containing protein [Halomonas korlensis]|uniref:PIN-like domain-containing protein n=1 Tax=Halomonas korlensis TaxID=463301 RepID=A0A1I7IZ50_9GAMM|nr:PIN domain-containing protein [Halomonas korlensis]SFU78245.1 hypothetical protein SAMN04487955_108173 [Halomonas korlensis]
MKTNYVLIDFENVQPVDLGLLNGHAFKVKVFMGANQTKVPIALASALQALGESAEYITLASSGRNALDFHIAYYLGVLSSHDPKAFFHVISKDAGFDPLIKHLKSKGVFAQRSVSISDIPFFNAPASQPRLLVVVDDLIRRKASKPRRQKTLLSTMAALFNKELSETELQELFESFVQTRCSAGRRNQSYL